MRGFTSRFVTASLPVLAFTLLALLACPAQADAGRIAPGLERALSAAGDEAPFTVWVFLQDRGLREGDVAGALADAERNLNPRARARRLARGGLPLVSERDLPVAASHISAMESAGACVRARSRWLNAVSIEATPASVRQIAALPFVDVVRAVATAPARDRLGSLLGHREIPASGRADEPRRLATARGGGAPAGGLDYGLSYGQLQQIQVPALHNMGLTGAGVRVGMLDTGFRLTHEVLSALNVLVEYDFINDDSITANEPGEDVADQDLHGTLTMSLLGGYRPGTMLGPAFDAEFVLAKTEVLNYERPLEEDFWVEGIEWIESWGCDVASNSLGYFNFENPYPDYTYSDMNGDTAVTTIAADLAVGYGLVLVNCAGNAGDDPVYKKMIAPSDADSAMGVGAVDSIGAVTPYSSQGPTFDGRIKPDLCARGDVDICALASSGGYIPATGTSCSTPLLGGVCALVLQAHPEWTPMQLTVYLKATATRAHNPDTLFGWGIVKPLDAISTFGTSVPELPTDISPDRALSLRAYPNPSRGDASLVLARRAVAGTSAGTSAGLGEAGASSLTSSLARLTILDVQGRRVLETSLPLPAPGEASSLGIAPRSGGRLAPGVYLARVDAGSLAAETKVLVLP